jgi:hypothetical protein
VVVIDNPIEGERGDVTKGRAEMPHVIYISYPGANCHVTSATLLMISGFVLCIVINSYFAVTGTEIINIGYDKDPLCRL